MLSSITYKSKCSIFAHVNQYENYTDVCTKKEFMPLMCNTFHKLKLVLLLPRLDNRVLISLLANKPFILAILAYTVEVGLEYTHC